MEDKVQSGRVLDLQVEIHQPCRETPRIKEVAGPMKYQLAQIVRRSIGASVTWKTWLVMGVVKRGNKLKTVQRGIEHKELEHQRQP